MRKLVTVLAIVAAAAIVGGGVLYSLRKEAKQEYRLAAIERGDVVNTVSASGTLSAVITVQVGSQVSGQIAELLVDYNSRVKAGQVVARLDGANFAARVREAEAEVAVARANLTMQNAAVARARAELKTAGSAVEAMHADIEQGSIAAAEAQSDLTEKLSLQRRALVSDREVADARAAQGASRARLKSLRAQARGQEAALEARKAQLKIAEAQVAQARAVIQQREAALARSRIDMEHTVIRAPVDGIVIERSVDVGQTVAASLQAPNLFTIAQDLRNMQVVTSVDEADIGQIAVGQKATFTVDAFPGEKFTGKVEQIRKAPQVVQNVVTYNVIVTAANRAQKLLPGFTANVQIATDEARGVLKVPNAALRFKPLPGDEAAAAQNGGQPPGGGGRFGPGSAGAARIQGLTRVLELSEQQQKRLEGMVAARRAEFRALRARGLDGEVLRAEGRRLREDGKEAIKGILTPAQRQKYEQILAGLPNRGKVPGRVWLYEENGGIKAVNVMTGISDGTFTTVTGPDLEAGQQVVTGYRRPPPKPASRSRRRWGF